VDCVALRKRSNDVLATVLMTRVLDYHQSFTPGERGSTLKMGFGFDSYDRCRLCLRKPALEGEKGRIVDSRVRRSEIASDRRLWDLA
jgi:hypothetical protein